MRKKSGLTIVEQATVLVPEFENVVRKMDQQVTLRNQSKSTLNNYIRRIALFVLCMCCMKRVRHARSQTKTVFMRSFKSKNQHCNIYRPARSEGGQLPKAQKNQQYFKEC